MQQSTLQLKYGFLELVNLINLKNIQFFIVSAGFASVIHEIIYLIEESYPFEHVLKWYKPDLNKIEHLKIVSNIEFYDENNVLVGFQKPPVTSMNKFTVLNYENYPTLRKNAIVIGDLVDDLKMIQNIQPQALLKIGFFNEQEVFIKK